MNSEKFHAFLDFPEISPVFRPLAAGFAQEALAAFPQISQIYPLPPAIWQKAADTGITGIGIDPAFGGKGGGYEDIFASSAEISFWSRSPGLALCLFIHQVVSCFSIASLASPEQKKTYLPLLSTGKTTVAQAVSEPHGNHPAQMKTRAERTAQGWKLDGEKAFVTNGPQAGMFITLAVTGERNGQKEFSAFLVPSDLDGVQVRDIGPLSFLRPAPHGSVRFTKVELAEGLLLGEEGKALEFFSRPFAALEDTLMTGIMAGGFAALLMCLCRDIVRSGTISREKQGQAGRLQGVVSSYSRIAAQGAKITAPEALTDKAGYMRMTLRQLALLTLDLFHELAGGIPLCVDSETLLRDLEKSLSIRGTSARIREEKAGRELLTG